MGRWFVEGESAMWLWWVLVVVAAATTGARAELCPLNFTVLDEYPLVAEQVRAVGAQDKRCLTLTHGVDVVLSVYLKQTGNFLPPPEDAQSCLAAVERYFRVENVTSLCGLSMTNNRSCQGIATREDFRSVVTTAGVASSLQTCNNGVLANGNAKSAACAACTKAISLVANSLRSSDGSDSNLCLEYTDMYTAAEVLNAGPLDATTLVCLWDLLSVTKSSERQWWLYLVIGAAAIFVCSFCAWIVFISLRRIRKRNRNDEFEHQMKSMLGGGLTWYSIEEIRAATRNFDMEMILGQGGFGNVYKGILRNGDEVACKRFKDCSAEGDAGFLHEVQALASVRHKNLNALRGCCIAKLVEEGFSGHQRIIVLDYVKNGSLHDHLFSSPGLTWPQRHKIATDTARGLQYLHAGAQVQILHRDVKPSNILLDEDFNAMVADFGLVKFTPEGMSHVTTRAAGSFGYVAPECAMYNQLTDRSDVYSFGIVLLELISGRKAMAPDAETGELLIDWAWRLMKEGRWAAIVDPRLGAEPELDMERFVILALLCAHPQVFYRPSMTAVLRMLENLQLPMPPLPDRPVPPTYSEAAFNAALIPPSSMSSSFYLSFTSATSHGNSQDD